MQATNPFLILGYGAQMMFILEQRLLAQAVKNEKGCKVLSDVAGSLYDPSFIDELLKPALQKQQNQAQSNQNQRIWTRGEARQVFEGLASSSIMKLSTASMDKLYDLMTMGLKYHALLSVYPRDITHNSLRLLSAMQELLVTNEPTGGSGGKNTLANVNEAIRAVYGLSNSLTVGQCADVRYGILNFLQGKKIRVTLFLNEGLQNKQGQFILTQTRNRSAVDPPLTEQFPDIQPIGTVRYFQGGAVAGTEVLANHPHAQPAAAHEIVPEVKIGHVLYGTNRSSQNPTPTVTNDHGNKAATSASTSASTTQDEQMAASAGRSRSAAPSNNTAINHIMGLTAVSFSHSQQAGESFKLNLFNDSGDDRNDLLRTTEPATGATSVEVAGRRDNAHLNNVMSGFSSGAGGAAADGDDDLLALMEGSSS